jgi:hypothetical protein
MSADDVGTCIRAKGLEVLIEKHKFLVYDTVSARSSGNLVRIQLWDETERAMQEVERLRFEAPAEQRTRFNRSGNAVVAWDTVPSPVDSAAVMGCLSE